MIKPAASPIKLAVALLILGLLAAVGFQVRGSGVKESSDRKQLAVAEAIISPTGGAVALPGNDVFVSVAPGIVEEPIRVRIEEVAPEDAPGPITEGVTVIKGVKVTLPGYDYSQPYAGNFKGRQLLVAFKAEGFVEEPNLFGDYYTAVCFWDDFEGRGTSGVLSWACRYGSESSIYEVNSERYYFYWLDVVPPRGRYLYLVQYPKELSRQNCEAIGGKFTGDDGVPDCSFGYQSPYWAQESMGAWVKDTKDPPDKRSKP